MIESRICKYCSREIEPNNSLIKLKNNEYVCCSCLKIHKEVLLKKKLINKNSYWIKILESENNLR